MEKKTHGIINLPIKQLHPHPQNPRKDVGDVEELAKSIRVNGLMQNLTVIPMDKNKKVSPADDFMVLIGHRRLAAAKLAGLTELPCKIVEGLSEREQLSTMLEENMQRTDLTIYEQAEGFQLMLDLGETMETIQEKTGFSETTIRHRLNIAKLDKKTLKKAEECFQISITDLALLERVKDIKTRNEILAECRDHRDFKWKVNNAAANEKRDEAEKELFKLLDTYGVKKAPEDFTPFRPFIFTAKEFDLDGKIPKKSFKWDKEPPKDAELLYYRAYGSTAKICYKGKKPPEQKKTPEELKRIETDKNRKKIKAIFKGFADERRRFVLDVIAGKYERPEDPEKIIKECLELMLKIHTSISYHEITGYLGGRNYWDLEEKEKEELKGKAMGLSLEHSLLILADGRIGADTETADYQGHFVEKDEDYCSSVLYLRKMIGILGEYGFRAEDPELLAVMDGTSELYEPAE